MNDTAANSATDVPAPSPWDGPAHHAENQRFEAAGEIALVPDSDRMVNLADAVPATPPTRMQSSFVHLGEKRSFRAQLGDVFPNHLSTTCLHAVERGCEQRGDDGPSDFRPVFEP